jgi:TPP-dependent pyruvate/acetoin dehydrogenase alpha subunit
MTRSVTEEVEKATEHAELATDPDPSTLTRHVYADA